MKNTWRLAILALVATLPFTALADEQAPPAAADEPALPKLNWQPGPAKIPLGHQLTLDLPEEHVYLNAKDAKKLLERSGNFVGDSFLGMVIPKDESGKAQWWVAIEYLDEGYIKDDEKLDANEILKTIREGQEEANEGRKEKGFPPLTIDGWSEAPHYDKNLHHLVWALELHSQHEDGPHKSVNFETRILGRKGYVSLNLITDPNTLAADKPEVQKLLTRTTFDAGARYADFDSKTDKVATYGLAALVAGGAGAAALKVAKVGLFAKFGKVLLLFLAKGFKLVIAFFIAIGVFFKKLFGGKQEPAPPASAEAVAQTQTGDAATTTSETPPVDEKPNDPSASAG